MRLLVLFLIGLFISGCQGTNPYGLTTASLGEKVVSQATGAAGEGVTPVKGIKYVSLHPDRLLRDEKTCVQVIKLSYASNINYSEEDELVTTITIEFEGINEPCEINTIQYEHPDWSNLTVTAFPIISAFAITTHKLQGQTIEDPLFIHYSNDIIPYYQKQEHLLYTAISRCKVKENVYIISDNEITSDHFPVNQYMFDWWRKINDDQPIIV